MASSYQQKYPVPDGFAEQLHDLMKAILREQPQDIIDYSYSYFKNMSEVNFYEKMKFRFLIHDFDYI